MPYEIDYRATAWLVGFIAVDIPVFILLARCFWSDMEDFWESLRFALMPDIISLLRGQWLEDTWAELRLAVFVFLCGLVIASEVILYGRFAG